MVRFEIGKVYECRSICDYDCIWTYTVVARTASTITIKNNSTGETQKNRILCYSKQFGVESVHPLGNYSMCPVLSADKMRCEKGEADAKEIAENIVNAYKRNNGDFISKMFLGLTDEQAKVMAMTMAAIMLKNEITNIQ